MIDPLAANKELEIFLEFPRIFLLENDVSECAYLLILHKQIYLNPIKWFISTSIFFKVISQ